VERKSAAGTDGAEASLAEVRVGSVGACLAWFGKSCPLEGRLRFDTAEWGMGV